MRFQKRYPFIPNIQSSSKRKRRFKFSNIFIRMFGFQYLYQGLPSDVYPGIWVYLYDSLIWGSLNIMNIITSELRFWRGERNHIVYTISFHHYLPFHIFFFYFYWFVDCWMTVDFTETCMLLVITFPSLVWLEWKLMKCCWFRGAHLFIGFVIYI